MLKFSARPYSATKVLDTEELATPVGSVNQSAMVGEKTKKKNPMESFRPGSVDWLPCNRFILRDNVACLNQNTSHLPVIKAH